jgi:hypothetical protein
MLLPPNFEDTFPDRGRWTPADILPKQAGMECELVLPDGRTERGVWSERGAFWWGYGKTLHPVAWRPISGTAG